MNALQNICSQIPENYKTESLYIVNKAFSHGPVTLKTSMDIYTIQRAIMDITNIVKTHLAHFKNEWMTCLANLNNYTFTVKNSYPIAVDTSIAQSVLLAPFPPPQIEMLNLRDDALRQAYIEYIMEVDQYTFRGRFPYAFYDTLLNNSDTLAVVAYDNNHHIIGGMWGFFTMSENNQKLFHVWSLTIRPEYSKLGIADGIIEYAKGQTSKFPDLKFATLNVHHHNAHARTIYDKKDFVEMPGQTKAEKIFMSLDVQNHVTNQTVPVSIDEAKSLCRKHIFKHAYKIQLAVWEISRRCQLLFSMIYWKCKNPSFQIVDFHREKKA